MRLVKNERDSLSKILSDYLRAWSFNETSEKLKASHAREIVAAFLGYKTHAALLADDRPFYEGIVIKNTEKLGNKFIRERLARLEGLSDNTPSANAISRKLNEWFLHLTED